MYYSMTLRKCAPIKPDEQLVRNLCYRYYGYITYLKQKFPRANCRYRFEYKRCKNGKLNVHLHALFKTPPHEKLYYTKVKGWSIDLQATLNHYAWNNYIKKDNITNIDKLIIDIFGTIEADSIEGASGDISEKSISDYNLEYQFTPDELRYPHLDIRKL